MIDLPVLKQLRQTTLWQKRGAPAARTVARIAGRAGADDVSLVAGGVAFYAFLSIFPAIASALMIWGVFTTDADLRTQLDFLSAIVPNAAYELISEQMVRIASSQSAGLSWGALFTLILAFWSASRAANALLTAVAVTYDSDKRHSFLRQNLIAVAFTAGGIVFALLSLAAIGAVPPILKALQLGAFLDALFRILRWVLLLSMFLGGIYVFYRLARPKGTPRASTRTRPVLPGTLVAGAIWLSASVGFSVYLSSFADYNETFGSLGAAVALLMWLWLSAVAICIGAETNGVFAREIRAREHCQ